jgi:hypothetical protein
MQAVTSKNAKDQRYLKLTYKLNRDWNSGFGIRFSEKVIFDFIWLRANPKPVT